MLPFYYCEKKTLCNKKNYFTPDKRYLGLKHYIHKSPFHGGFLVANSHL